MIVLKLEALFTINTSAIQFKRAASELDNLANKAETVMKAIAGYWAVQALQNLVVNTANAMAEIGKTGEYLGIAGDALQELRYAAEKSGVSVDALNDALKELQVRAVDAKSGEGEAAEAFQMLGLKSIDAAEKIREPLELLDAVADRLGLFSAHDTACFNWCVGLQAIKAAIAFGPMILFAGAVLAGITAVALIVDDLWTALRGGDSVFLSLHKKARAFFGPIEQWLLSLPKAFLDWLTKGIGQGLDWIK